MLPLLLLLAGSHLCLGPDLLHPAGNFEEWQGNDAQGWERLSFGNGVRASITQGTRGNYSAGFQTVYGPAELAATVSLSEGTNWAVAAQMGGQMAGTVALRVRDTGSGRYLNASGSWQDAPTDAIIQQLVGFPRELSLPFTAEGPDRTLRVTVRSNGFGVARPDGLYDCSPGLCPTGWVDDVRLCSR